MKTLLVVLAAVTLRWDAAPTATNFTLESRNPGESWGSPASFPADACIGRAQWVRDHWEPFNRCDLALGNLKWRRVKACNDGGCSGWTEEARVSCTPMAQELLPGSECPTWLFPTEPVP